MLLEKQKKNTSCANSNTKIDRQTHNRGERNTERKRERGHNSRVVKGTAFGRELTKF